MFVSRFCYNVDPPGGGGGSAPPAAPAPAPSPAGAPPAAPAPTATVIGEPPALPPNAVIQIGNEFRTVQEIIEENQQKAGLSPEELEAFKTFQAVRSGDRDAILKMFPGAEPPPQPQDPNVLIQSMQQQIAEMKAQLEQVNEPVSRINQLRDESMMRETVKSYADKLPHLAHVLTQDPTKASELVNAVTYNMQVLAQQKPNTPRDVLRQEATAMALYGAEQSVAHMAQLFNAQFKPPTKAAPGANVQTANGQTVPGFVPSPTGPGTAVSPTAGAAQEGEKFSLDDLKGRVRDRLTGMNIGQ